MEGVGYRFHLDFQQQVPAGTGVPVAVKALFTGRVESRDSPGKVYYPPLLPCETDLANVPSITLPESAMLEPLALPMNAAGCINRVYTYFRFSPPCDLDNDTDVDRDDYRLILSRRNTAADAGDPRDVNGDGIINLLDARTCVLQCTRARCAT